MLERIIDGLFPRHDPSPRSGKITDEELAASTKSFGVGKAQGPDEASNQALIVVIAEAAGCSNQLCGHVWTRESSQRFESGKAWSYCQRQRPGEPSLAGYDGEDGREDHPKHTVEAHQERTATILVSGRED